MIDSRDIHHGTVVRRRRECPACGRRFTTYENVDVPELAVVKRDGRREPFDRHKLREKIRIALTKRPVPSAELDRVVAEIELKLSDSGNPEVSSTEIGELVLAALRELDQVAYIRFASVYREFRDLDDWRRVMASLDEAAATRSSTPTPTSDS